MNRMLRDLAIPIAEQRRTSRQMSCGKHVPMIAGIEQCAHTRKPDNSKPLMIGHARRKRAWYDEFSFF